MVSQYGQEILGGMISEMTAKEVTDHFWDKNFGRNKSTRKIDT